MNSVDIYIVVEGPTEQTFVRDVLAPQMAHEGIYLHPVLIGKPGHKGGDVRFIRAKNDIGNFLRQRSDTYISTMFDYFRIDSKGLTINNLNNIMRLISEFCSSIHHERFLFSNLLSAYPHRKL